MTAPYQTGLRGRQTSYRLRLDPGSYSYSGRDLSFPQRLSLDRGSYSYAGQAVALAPNIVSQQFARHLSGTSPDTSFTQTIVPPFAGSKLLSLVTYRGDVVQSLFPNGAATSVIYRAFDSGNHLLWTQSAVRDALIVSPFSAYGPHCAMWRLDNVQSSAGVAEVRVTTTLNKSQWLGYYLREYVGLAPGGPLTSTGSAVTGNNVYPTAGTLGIGEAYPFLLFGGFNAFYLNRTGGGGIDPTPPPGFTDLEFSTNNTNVDGPLMLDAVDAAADNYSGTITWGSIFGSPYIIAHGCTALIAAYAGVAPA